MQEAFEINAVTRSDGGKGASRRLRREGLVPGIIYGGGKDPEMIATRHNELFHHLENEAFYSHILTVKIDGKPQNVVLRDLQRHPAKPFIQHFDFMRIRMGEVIRMTVPLHIEGEDVCVGIKAGGTALHGMNDLEIECLPQNLPEYIAVDASQLEIGDVIHLSQVVMPEGVTLAGSDQLDEDYDPVVVSVEMVRAAAAAETAEEEAPSAEATPSGKETSEESDGEG
jgi:large subunit ribosomal protein L25